MSVFRDIRVIPVVLFAVFSLAVLKGASLIINGGYVFDYQPDSPKRSWAQEAFNFPGAATSEAADITGSVPQKVPGAWRQRGSIESMETRILAPGPGNG